MNTQVRIVLVVAMTTMLVIACECGDLRSYYCEMNTVDKIEMFFRFNCRQQMHKLWGDEAAKSAKPKLSRSRLSKRECLTMRDYADFYQDCCLSERGCDPEYYLQSYCNCY
ncbi:uncharacterized protein LOC116616829 [Nematostella vectensis]|uniref:uncharacterized protein LOC116616829 n=1 Tax=Nematostella vectensis TaxID=45351 RepID=UPI002076DE0D|nr:uncharacterized protein LOC116616829 [Nematostella vectensis]